MLISSCGVITKARYGNGFKLNIETGLFSKNKTVHQPTLSKASLKKSMQKQDISSKDSVIFYSEINENSPIDTIASICWFTQNKQNESIVKSKPQPRVFESKKWKNFKPKHVEKKVNIKHDERPLAPYLIWALILAFFIPYVSLRLVIKSKKIIRESNYAYKGRNFANIILIFVIIYLPFFLYVTSLIGFVC